MRILHQFFLGHDLLFLLCVCVCVYALSFVKLNFHFCISYMDA